jgi:hypothetical protein
MGAEQERRRVLADQRRIMTSFVDERDTPLNRAIERLAHHDAKRHGHLWDALPWNSGPAGRTDQAQFVVAAAHRVEMLVSNGYLELIEDMPSEVDALAEQVTLSSHDDAALTALLDAADVPETDATGERVAVAQRVALLVGQRDKARRHLRGLLHEDRKTQRAKDRSSE